MGVEWSLKRSEQLSSIQIKGNSKFSSCKRSTSITCCPEPPPFKKFFHSLLPITAMQKQQKQSKWNWNFYSDGPLSLSSDFDPTRVLGFSDECSVPVNTTVQVLKNNTTH